jgi:glycosyltransferase involved in cell wall biosynthesis
MMLRVLHCIYDDPRNPWIGGGGAVRAFDLYRHLVGEVDVTVLSGNFPGARDETIDGVRYVRAGADRPYAWSRFTYAREATRRLAAGEYDVGVVDFSVYTPIRMPRNRPIGVIVHMLHGPTASQRWGRALGPAVGRFERSLLRRARVVCTTSGWMEEQLRPILPAATTLVRVSSGVPEEFFGVRRQEGDFLLYYGRFDVFHKGIDLLLESMRQLLPHRPALQLRIAGRGKDGERIRAMIGASGLEGSVRLMEFVSRAEVLDLLSGALLLAMPSRLEGLAMVPAEAMAAGVPVIAADVGALREVVQPPDGGILIPGDDAGALTAAISELLDDSARRSSISETARQSAERFRWKAVAGAHLGFLQRIREEGGRRSPAGSQ